LSVNPQDPERRRLREMIRIGSEAELHVRP
jgi:hypothetical protein